METVAIILLIVACALAQSTKKPNIVVILADDMGFNDVSYHGSDLNPTPNIDALAYSGTVLERHYVLPICTPSRAAFMTGRHPLRFGRQGYPLKAGENGGIPLEHKLMPEYLKELGYRTHMVGKWHLGYSTNRSLPNNRGFDSFLGYYNGYIDYYLLDNNQTLTERDGTFRGYDFHDENGPRWEEKGKYATDIFTEAAVKIIKNHDSKDPLFLYVAQLAPHTGTEEGHGLQPPPGTDPDTLYPHVKDPAKRSYAALMTSLDKSVGQIFQALEEAGILQNSVVLFMADNGAASVANDMPPNYGSNWPLRGVKFTLYEGGVRGAAVIWSPLFKTSNRIKNSTFHITDWLPTFVKAAGGEADDTDGRSQWEALKSDDKADDRSLILNIDDLQNSEAVLLDGQWKLIKQNQREYAEYDHHYQVQQNHENLPPVTPKMVRESAVGSIVREKYGANLEDATIDRMREDLTISCAVNETRPMGPVNGSKAFLCSDYCIFDVKNDPCELVPFHDEKIMKRGVAMLESWRPKLGHQIRPIVDEKANPEYFHGVWSPWLEGANSGDTTELNLNVVCLVSLCVTYFRS